MAAGTAVGAGLDRVLKPDRLLYRACCQRQGIPWSIGGLHRATIRKSEREFRGGCLPGGRGFHYGRVLEPAVLSVYKRERGRGQRCAHEEARRAGAGPQCVYQRRGQGRLCRTLVAGLLEWM